MSAELQRVEAKVDAMLAEFRTLKAILTPEQKKPGFTTKAFAKLIGRSETTVERMLKRGELRREKGRIPASLAAPYLS